MHNKVHSCKHLLFTIVVRAKIFAYRVIFEEKRKWTWTWNGQKFYDFVYTEIQFRRKRSIKYSDKVEGEIQKNCKHMNIRSNEVRNKSSLYQILSFIRSTNFDYTLHKFISLITIYLLCF